MTNNNDRIFDLLSGTLSSDEQARLHRDITADPELAEELRLQTQAIEWLAETDTPLLSEFESAKLRSAIRASVSRNPQASGVPGDVARPSSRLTWILATAAVILVLVGVVSVLPKLGGDAAYDNVAIADATADATAPVAALTDDEQTVGSAEMAAPATTTTAAAAGTTIAEAAAADSSPLDEDGAEFAAGDLTAAEYLSITETSPETYTRTVPKAIQSDLLVTCLATLENDGFELFSLEISTYSGEVVFAERLDEGGNTVEVVKFLIDGCAEIDRAP